MPRRLIINADDFGNAKGSVPAVIALYEADIVTSASAMVNQPLWPKAAAYLRDHPGLGAGVHLVLNGLVGLIQRLVQKWRKGGSAEQHANT